MLQFVITKNDYSLCLVNDSLVDLKELYINYYGSAVEGTEFYEFKPQFIKTYHFESESYVTIEEYNAWELDTTFYYETLCLKENSLVLQKFYRNKLNNVATVTTHPIIEGKVWKIEEVKHKKIEKSLIVDLVFDDIYAATPQEDCAKYKSLVRHYDLMPIFIEDLYNLMEEYYNGALRNLEIKDQLAGILIEKGVQFEQSEGTDIILSHCSGLMQKLHISLNDMANLFLHSIDRMN